MTSTQYEKYLILISQLPFMSLPLYIAVKINVMETIHPNFILLNLLLTHHCSWLIHTKNWKGRLTEDHFSCFMGKKVHVISNYGGTLIRVHFYDISTCICIGRKFAKHRFTIKHNKPQ